ncbi:hypothetical protein ACWDTR_20210 [Streptomyces sp. NPDC003470]|uniref:hypothetical protein n=1 Tax=Streptomyces sp. NPDC059701 TaxID=3346914 RepID=UPI0036AEF553
MDLDGARVRVAGATGVRGGAPAPVAAPGAPYPTVPTSGLRARRTGPGRAVPAPAGAADPDAGAPRTAADRAPAAERRAG